MKTRIITRWERSVEDDDGGQLKHLQISLTPPPANERDWEKRIARVWPTFTYLD